MGRRQVCAWYGDKALPLCNEFKGTSLTLPEFREGQVSRHCPRPAISCYLRVDRRCRSESNKLTVVTSEPFDKDLVGNIASDLGEITLYASGRHAGRRIETRSGHRPAGPLPLRQNKSGNRRQFRQARRPGQRTRGIAGPASPSALCRIRRHLRPRDHVRHAACRRRLEHRRAGASRALCLQVDHAARVLYGHLFAALGEFVQGVAYILLGVGDLLCHHRTDRADHRHAHDPHRHRCGGATARRHAARGSRRLQPSHSGEVQRPTRGSRALVQLHDRFHREADSGAERKAAAGKRTRHRAGSAGAAISRARFRSWSRWRCMDSAVRRAPSAATTTIF